MRFHEFLSHRLHYITQYPQDPHGFDLQVPPYLLSRMQRQFVIIAKKSNPDRARQAIREEIDNNRLEIHLRRALYRIKTLDGDLWQDSLRVEKLCAFLVAYIARNFPIDVERRSFTFGARSDDEETESLFDELDLHRVTSYKGFDGLEYAHHNNLCTWTGREWVITPLGIAFMRLSSIHQVMMLLQIEIALASPEVEPWKMEIWHMPKRFVEEIVRSGGFHFILDDDNEIEKYDPVLAYTSRLEDMGLLWSEDVSEEVWAASDPPNIPIFHAGDDHWEIRLTDLGKKLLPEVVSSEGKWMDGLIKIGLDPALSQISHLTLDVESMIDSLGMELSSNAAFREQRQIVEKAMEDLRTGTTPLVVLRALQPSIEKFLKNMLSIEGLVSQADFADMTLGPSLDRYQSLARTGGGILSDQTIRYIRVLDRNGILHANLNPPEEMALLFVSMVLNILRYASEEYRAYKEATGH